MQENNLFSCPLHTFRLLCRVPWVVLCSIIFCYIWLYCLELPSDQHVADYQFAVYMFSISCVVESFMEPVYSFSQAFLYIKLRVSFHHHMLVSCKLMKKISLCSRLWTLQSCSLRWGHWQYVGCGTLHTPSNRWPMGSWQDPRRCWSSTGFTFM